MMLCVSATEETLRGPAAARPVSAAAAAPPITAPPAAAAGAGAAALATVFGVLFDFVSVALLAAGSSCRSTSTLGKCGVSSARAPATRAVGTPEVEGELSAAGAPEPGPPVDTCLIASGTLPCRTGCTPVPFVGGGVAWRDGIAGGLASPALSEPPAFEVTAVLPLAGGFDLFP